jgi:dipicolinate synthase subunit A
LTASEEGVAWRSLRIAVVGGDEREPEIARLAAEAGATVKANGIPWPAAGIPDVELADSPRDAVLDAHYIFLPIPIGVGLSVYAPRASEPVIVDRELFSHAAAGAYAFAGQATPEVRAAAEAAGVHVHDYDSDRELMLLRGSAIVEGTLQQAIAATDVTIHNAEVVVVGFGNIGQLLARTLRALGARVHVAARNRTQRAEAYADGLLPLTLEELPHLAPSLAMVFSTVPAQVVDRAILERLPRGSLVLDIAPPPHHADLELAAELGHRVVWARGMGKRAPVTVGASQWSGLRRYIGEIETARKQGRTWDG